MKKRNELAKKWATIVAKAWADEGYKKRLIEDPATVLSEEGMGVAKGVEIKVVEATERQAWLVLPPKPENDKIETGEERLAAILSHMSCGMPQIG